MGVEIVVSVFGDIFSLDHLHFEVVAQVGVDGDVRRARLAPARNVVPVVFQQQHLPLSRLRSERLFRHLFFQCAQVQRIQVDDPAAIRKLQPGGVALDGNLGLRDQLAKNDFLLSLPVEHQMDVIGFRYRLVRLGSIALPARRQGCDKPEGGQQGKRNVVIMFHV